MEYVDIATKEQTMSANNLTITENMEKIYDAGKKSQYDEFWDDYQKNGKRTYYIFAFAGAGWTKDNLKPKYKVVPLNSSQGGSQIFDRCNFGNDEAIDFSLIADMFDFSNIVYAYGLFKDAKMNNIIADLSSATTLGDAFTNIWGTYTIKNITIKVNENATMTSAFNIMVENLNFMEGSVIGKSITVNSRNLTKESAINIIAHLKNYKGTPNEGTYVLTLSSQTWSLLDNDTGEPETGLSWRDYIESIGWVC